MTDSQNEEKSSNNADEESSDERNDPFEGFEEDHLYEDWDDLAADPEEVSRFGRAIEGLLPDVLKRGFDGLVSEDGIRSIVRQKELPREVVGFILGQVDATKREVLRVVSREVRMFLQDVDLGGELTKILTSVSFEIRTEVRFIPNEDVFKPEIKNKVSMKGDDGEKTTISEMDEDQEGSKRDDDNGAGSDSDDGEEEKQGRSSRRWGFRRREDEVDEPKEDDEEL